MDATVRRRYSGTPFSLLAVPVKGPAPSATAALRPAAARPSGPPARRKPMPHHEERPP